MASPLGHPMQALGLARSDIDLGVAGFARDEEQTADCIVRSDGRLSVIGSRPSHERSEAWKLNLELHFVESSSTNYIMCVLVRRLTQRRPTNIEAASASILPSNTSMKPMGTDDLRRRRVVSFASSCRFETSAACSEPANISTPRLEVDERRKSVRGHDRPSCLPDCSFFFTEILCRYPRASLAEIKPTMTR